jgi:hypothetical protein
MVNSHFEKKTCMNKFLRFVAVLLLGDELLTDVEKD